MGGASLVFITKFINFIAAAVQLMPRMLTDDQWNLYCREERSKHFNFPGSCRFFSFDKIPELCREKMSTKQFFFFCFSFEKVSWKFHGFVGGSVNRNVDVLYPLDAHRKSSKNQQIGT